MHSTPLAMAAFVRRYPFENHQGSLMDNKWKRRDVILGAAALAAAAGIDGAARAAPGSADKPAPAGQPASTDKAATAKDGKAAASDAERNKRLVRERREAAQHHALPSA